VFYTLSNSKVIEGSVRDPSTNMGIVIQVDDITSWKGLCTVNCIHLFQQRYKRQGVSLKYSFKINLNKNKYNDYNQQQLLPVCLCLPGNTNILQLIYVKCVVAILENISYFWNE
jgi:hypothetical protein